MNDLDGQIKLAVQGDQGALEILLLHYHDPLGAYLKSSFSSDLWTWTSPEDILQDVFVRAFRGVTKIEVCGSLAFLAWLKTIARRRVLTLIKAHDAAKRGAGRRQIMERDGTHTAATLILDRIAGTDASPSLIVRRKEALSVVIKAIENLPPDYRQLVQLRYVDGLSVPEIAARINKSEGAVKMGMRRAIDSMRAALSSKFGNFPSAA